MNTHTEVTVWPENYLNYQDIVIEIIFLTWLATHLTEDVDISYLVIITGNIDKTACIYTFLTECQYVIKESTYWPLVIFFLTQKSDNHSDHHHCNANESSFNHTGLSKSD